MWNILKKIAADSVGSYDDVKNKFPQKNDGIAAHPEILINYFLYIGGIVAVVMIVIAGIKMTTSAGDPAAVAKAKNTLVWSIIGLVLMVLAYAVVNFVVFKITGTES